MNVVGYLPVPYLLTRPTSSIGQDSSAFSGGAGWPSANRAIYAPFSLPYTKLVTSMSWWNAGSATGNYDIGIYDGTCTTLLVSSGISGTSTNLNTFTLPVPIQLEAGVRYYAGLMLTSTSPQPVKWDTPTVGLIASALYQEATAGTLPSTATPVDVASAYHPGIVLDFAQ